MAESFRTRLLRWRFNLHPAYRRSGGRLTYVAADLHEVRVRLPLCRATRNLNGTIYGGSIYAAVDALHAVMIAQLLGPREYVAWTKAAHVRFCARRARTWKRASCSATRKCAPCATRPNGPGRSSAGTPWS